MKGDSPVQKRARKCGVHSSYIDSEGREQVISDERLKVILEKLAAPRQLAEPVFVLWKGARSLKARLREKPREVELRLEGSDDSAPLRDLSLSQKENGEVLLDLPRAGLPVGYHQLTFRFSRREHTALLISAPRKLYAESRRQWGAFLPLYAAHSRQSWGAGNLSDWKNFALWVGAQGGRVVGTLPLLAAFLDRPICEPSPYSPASRLFWNEFFIDPAALPEFAASSAARRLVNSGVFQRQLARFRARDLVDYPAEWALRRQVLEILSAEFFSSDRRAELKRCLSMRPALEDYASFRAACDHYGTSWHSWPAGAREGRLRAADFDESTKRFYLYAQWAAQRQMDDVLSACAAHSVDFYLDLPLGVHPDGYDAWRHREFFAQGVSTGAPPDSVFTKGQDWGFAPPDPVRMREQHYRYVIDYLRFQMRHTGLLRIDHVMGLHRLWWVPHGRPASEGAYVSYRADELYAILSVESHRHKTMLVGENLGTVPHEVNKSMDRHALRRMYVVQYEQVSDGVLREPEAPVVASMNTHDMPMFASHWKGTDILDRADLGLVPNIKDEKRRRARTKREIITFLRKRKLLAGSASSRNVCSAILKFLSRSPAETVLVNLEDLWGEERSQNVPGTSIERPNWRRKTALSLDDILADKGLVKRLHDIMAGRMAAERSAHR